MGAAGVMLLAAGLSMDAFAVSVCKGLSLGKIRLKDMFIVGAWFGIFQAVMPLMGGFEKLFYRNLLYTAVTRAKKLLIIIGTEEIITKMVVNNKRTNRYTCLTAMLREEIKPHE